MGDIIRRMVEFKKDKGKKERRIKELMGYMSIFFSGFIIALFLVMYVVLLSVNLLISNNKEEYKEEDEPISSEPISNSSDNIDQYINEKALLANLLTVCKDMNQALIVLIILPMMQIICISLQAGSIIYIS